MAQQWLPFEKEIYEMEELLSRLESGSNGDLSNSEELRRLGASWFC